MAKICVGADRNELILHALEMCIEIEEKELKELLKEGETAVTKMLTDQLNSLDNLAEEFENLVRFS